MALQDAPSERRSLASVITASSAGTLIEWYDFYIFGTLSTIIAKQFWGSGSDFEGILKTLAVFGIGFVFRPFGALVFGRMGDLLGRKHTFLVTLLIMGFATFAIGIMPTYDQIGVLAPIILIVLRILQGLALGGEYGGAATYVAEHSPPGRRGYYTSFIQTTATLGLLTSIIVILVTRKTLGEASFSTYGWRIPFLLSAVLVLLSYRIRLKMEESPMFAELRAKGELSKNPLVESFVNPENRKYVIFALLAATAGQGVVWYTGQFYAMFFIEKTLNVAPQQMNIIVAIALVLATPLFIVFGSLSDRIGRRKVMMAGMALAAIFFVPIYQGMTTIAHPPEVAAITQTTKIDKSVDPVLKTGQMWEVTKKSYENGFDIVTKRKLISETPHRSDPKEKPKTEITLPLSMAAMLGLLVFIQVVFVTMVYGPIAAYLIELFPTKIRYTSMSLPYHIGNGVFGGLLPLIAAKLAESFGNPLAGLAYPIAVIVITLVISTAYGKKFDRDLGTDAA